MIAPIPISGTDDSAGNKNVAFTMQHSLNSGERVVHGYLAMSLKQTGDNVTNDFLQLFNKDSEHRLNFADLGWSSRINASTPFVGVIDMGYYLDPLQDGSVNLLVSDDVAMD